MEINNPKLLNHQPELAGGLHLKGFIFLSPFVGVLAMGFSLIAKFIFQVHWGVGSGISLFVALPIIIDMLKRNSKVPYQINSFVLEKIKGKDVMIYEENFWTKENFKLKNENSKS
ncbi:hypothetical protein [Xanthovirga aplysinae]|uniref:hypothetical protein n=1 Tax=Xanthovirga aplysinae TaxID=2529853 RepID=UPI0012BC261A|nr:hypothetical protein [Xanthovirga aplysinae]MTI33302.1 hypothetical protein [Xanthovirga aplysinae]